MNKITLSLILVSLLFNSASTAEQKRPNILFAFADDWGRHASVYTTVDGPGTVNDIINTPNFDALTKKGVLFNNAFVSSPSCTPCRSSIIAGQHFWRTGKGAILQGSQWDVNIPDYSLLLRNSGYYIGKFFKVWKIRGDIGPYGAQKYDFSKHGRNVNRFSQYVDKARLEGKSVEATKAKLMGEVRANFRDFLSQREKGKPFKYWYGPTNVHRNWMKGSGKTIWGLDPDQLKGKMPPFLPDVHAVREDLTDYFGEIQAFDAALGVLVDELKKSGEYENTIIVVSGDHGAPGFPYGKCNLYDFGSRVSLLVSGPGVKGNRVVEDMVSLPDVAPTLLEAGGVPVPEVMTAKSLWPVLKSTENGLVDPNRTEVYIGRERHVAKARKGNLTYPQRAIRTHDYLFIINFKPERYPLGDPFLLGTDKEPDEETITNRTSVTLPDEDCGPTKAWLVKNRMKWSKHFEQAYGKRPKYELYDLKKDPHQVNNVASHSEYKEVLNRLHKQLIQELKDSEDPRMIDGGRFFETLP